MASVEEVRKYLAYWYQLGKGVVLENGGERILPEPIFSDGNYSKEFEECWQRLTAPESHDAYLEGTIQTIKQLLSPHWEISCCARCAMPVPMVQLGIQEPGCPCSDLTLWPNTELPLPHDPVNTKQGLNGIRHRLLSKLPPQAQGLSNVLDALALRKTKSHKPALYSEKWHEPPLTNHLSAKHCQEHNED